MMKKKNARLIHALDFFFPIEIRERKSPLFYSILMSDTLKPPYLLFERANNFLPLLAFLGSLSNL